MKKMTVDQFAEKIKAKYPTYQNQDNAVLVNKMIEKYPIYKDRVDLGTPSKAEQPKAKTKSNTLGAFTSGVSKGLTFGLSDLASTAVSAGVRKLKDRETPYKEHFSDIRREAKKREKEHPIASTLGEVTGVVNPSSVGSLALKGGAKGLAKIAGKKAIKQVPKKTLGAALGRTAGKIGATGAEGAALGTAEQAISEGKVDPAKVGYAAAGNVAMGGLGKVLGGAAPIGKNIFKSLAHKQHYMPGSKLSKKIIQSNVLRGSKTTKDLEKNFENFNKHDLWGDSFEEISSKVNDKVKVSANRLKSVVHRSPAKVNADELDNVFLKTRENMLNDTKLLNQYDVSQVKGALNRMEANLDHSILKQIDTYSGNIEPGVVLQLKRSADKNVNYNVVPDQKVLLKSKVYHEYRKHLDDLLEKKIGAKYKDANKELSELLPIKSRVEYNHNRQLQNLETDDVNFSPIEFAKKTLTGQSPKRDLKIAREIKGTTPYVLQIRDALSKGKPMFSKNINPKVGKYAAYKTFKDILNKEQEIDKKKVGRNLSSTIK